MKPPPRTYHYRFPPALPIPEDDPDWNWAISCMKKSTHRLLLDWRSLLNNTPILSTLTNAEHGSCRPVRMQTCATAGSPWRRPLERRS